MTRLHHAAVTATFTLGLLGVIGAGGVTGAGGVPRTATAAPRTVYCVEPVHLTVGPERLPPTPEICLPGP